MNVRNIKNGILGGLAGGAVFGMMMAMMGMLPMIGAMAGYPSALYGMVVHMAISAVVGAKFALLFGNRLNSSGRGLGYGLVYGGAWWVLGPLTLMPLFMGMGLGVNWNLQAATQMLPSLMGHLVFGALLGGIYSWLQDDVRRLAHAQSV